MMVLIFMAFLAALITLVSGFGLGTVLLPCFALFFPLPEAVALTAVVHFSNNLFKLGILRTWVDWGVWKRFAPAALVGAFGGSFLLGFLGEGPVLLRWTYGEVTALGLVVGLLLIVFALQEIRPFLFRKPGKHFAWAGGLLSGFFGGLSGNQGALRSAFLIRFPLTKEAYVATGTAIAMVIDITRIPLYASQLGVTTLEKHGGIMLAGVLAAVAGSLLGKRTLRKMKDRWVHALVAVFLFVSGLLMALGAL